MQHSVSINRNLVVFKNLSSLFMLLVFVFFSCLPFHAQEVNPNKLSEEMIGKSLKSTFKYLHKEFDMEFAYDVALIKNKECLERYSYQNPEDLLNKIISPYQLAFRKTGKIYIILPTEELNLKLEAGEITKTDFNLSGRVIDQNTGEPLPYAFLRFKNTNVWAESNVDGYFNFNKVPNDTLMLAVNYLGYNLFLERMNQIDNDDLIIALHVHGSSLSQVDIITEKIEAFDLDDRSDFQQIDPGQIDLISGNGQPDLFKGLQLIAGVQTQDASSSSLNIRNSQDGENLILIDNIPLYHLSHFFGTFSTLNPDMVKHVRLFKSAYGAEFGGRIGGVLDIATKDGDLQKIKAKFNLNLIGGGVLIETPLVKNKTTLVIGFRQSHINSFQSKIYRNLLEINFKEGTIGENFLEDFSVVDDAETSFFDLNLKVKHQLNKKTNISVTLLNAKDEYANTLIRKLDGNNIGQEFLITSFDDSNWGSLALGLGLNKQWNEGVHSTISIHRSAYESKYFFNDQVEELQFSTLVAQDIISGEEINDFEDSGILIAHLIEKDKHRLNFGINAQQFLQRNKNLNSQTGNMDEQSFRDKKKQSNLVSLFISDDYKFNSKFSMDLGLRVSKYSSDKDLNFSPRLQLRYAASERWTFKIGGGTYNQFVRKVASERLSKNQPDKWQLADDQIPSAYSEHLTAAVFYAAADWKIKLESYFKNNSSALINRNEDSLQTVSSSFTEELLVGRSDVVGADLSVLRTFKNHSGWIAYSIANAFNYFDEVNDGNAFNVSNNRLHDLKINYQYRVKSWALSVSYILASGKNYTPVLGTFINDLSGEQFLVYGDDYSAQLPEYSRADVGVKYNLKIKENVLRLGIGVYNIMNRTNISQRTYEAHKLGSSIDSQLIVNTIDLELLGISPNFSLSYAIN